MTVASDIWATPVGTVVLTSVVALSEKFSVSSVGVRFWRNMDWYAVPGARRVLVDLVGRIVLLFLFAHSLGLRVEVNCINDGFDPEAGEEDGRGLALVVGQEVHAVDKFLRGGEFGELCACGFLTCV